MLQRVVHKHRVDKVVTSPGTGVLQCVAVCCNCVATVLQLCFAVLQCIATVLQYVAVWHLLVKWLSRLVKVCCIVLQSVAVSCKCVVVFCSL